MMNLGQATLFPFPRWQQKKESPSFISEAAFLYCVLYFQFLRKQPKIENSASPAAFYRPWQVQS
jgi:hypothetical protein